MRLPGLVSLASLVLLAACSSSGTSATDAGSQKETSRTPTGNDTGTTSQDAGVSQDSGVSNDSGSTEEDAAPCNTLANSAASVTLTSSTATAPTATGGSVADGTYFLTSAVAYVPFDGDASVGTLSETLSVSGSTWQLVGTAIGDNEAGTFTFTTTGSSFTLAETCPGSESVTGTYTATATQLILFKSESLFGDTATITTTYTKQ